MAQRRFDITFSGATTGDQSVATVKENIKQLFKLDDQATEHMFSGKQVVIKKNLDRQTASRYQAALLKAGAKIQLVLHQAHKTNGASANNQAMQANSDRAISASPVSTDIKAESQEGLQALANNGDLLRNDEKKPFIPADISTERLSADAPEDPVTSTPFAEFNSNNLEGDSTPRYPGYDHIQLETTLTLAEAGSDLLSSNEKKVFQEADVDISRLSLLDDSE
jgi:hypothetical protein